MTDWQREAELLERTLVHAARQFVEVVREREELRAELMAERDEAREEAKQLRAVVDRVRQLHHRDDSEAGFCQECGFGWTCSTIRALDGETWTPSRPAPAQSHVDRGETVTDPRRAAALAELAGNHRQIVSIMVEMSDTLAKLAAAVDRWLPGDPTEYEARVRAQVAAEMADTLEDEDEDEDEDE